MFDRLWLKGHTITGLDLKDGDDINTCSLVYDDIDLVIHLAGKSGLRGSVTDPGPYWTHNVEASRKFHRAACGGRDG